jgi:hypothetical protein
MDTLCENHGRGPCPGGESCREDVETDMRSRRTFTPLLGTALAAVAAGSLLAFSLVAQQAGLGDLAVPGPVTASGARGSLGPITLPGAPGNPAPPGATEAAPSAPEPTVVASAPPPAPDVDSPPAPEAPAPRNDRPSFDGLEDDRRPTSTRVGNGELERGRQRKDHGRGPAGLFAARTEGDGSNERSAPPGHARKSGAPSSDRDRGKGPPSTPPGHAKQQARGDERGHGQGQVKHKGRGKQKGRAKHH